MLVRTTIPAPSGDLRAEVIDRADGLFEVMMLARIHEHVPESGLDEHVWVQTGRDKILTDSFEQAVELAHEEVRGRAAGALVEAEDGRAGAPLSRRHEGWPVPPVRRDGTIRRGGWARWRCEHS